MPEKWQETLVKLSPPNYGPVDSPVEALFCTVFDTCRDRLMIPADMRPITQHRCGKYRIDFAVPCTLGWLAVEIDGHEFHEKTKDQASKDRERERYLVSHGYRVIRFTGSDVWNNPFYCCRETADQIHILTYGKSASAAAAEAARSAIAALFEERWER